MARSGSKRRNSAASAQGQEADIAVLAIEPYFQGYGNPWFSVQAAYRRSLLQGEVVPLEEGAHRD